MDLIETFVPPYAFTSLMIICIFALLFVILLRVCVNPFDNCTTCYYCVRGQPQFCVNDGMKTAIGYQRDGGWQQYCLVPGHLCHVLPTTMTMSKAVLCQPLSMILRAWENMGSIEVDARVLVGGGGKFFVKVYNNAPHELKDQCKPF